MSEEKTEVEEKSLYQLKEEYNALGREHAATGMEFRERREYFSSPDEAANALEKLQSKIKAHKEALKSIATETTAEDLEDSEMTVKKAKTTKKKAAPKKAAPKKAAPKKAAGKRGRRSEYSEDQKIHVIQKDNPRREGTSVHKQYEIAKKSATVGAYLKAGGSLGSLRKCVKNGWMRVS